jgi:hypothetical protein
MSAKHICIPMDAMTAITPRHLASTSPSLEVDVTMTEAQAVEALANILGAFDADKALELIKRADSDLCAAIGTAAVEVAAEHSFERTFGVTA